MWMHINKGAALEESLLLVSLSSEHECMHCMTSNSGKPHLQTKGQVVVSKCSIDLQSQWLCMQRRRVGRVAPQLPHVWSVPGSSSCRRGECGLTSTTPRWLPLR